MTNSFFFLLILFLAAPALQAQVVINEIATSNKGSAFDEDGETPDWIELYNAGAAPVDLNEWSITDDSLEIEKWNFPQRIINPGEFLLVYASGKDRKGDYLHTNFKISKGNEDVFLFNAAGEKVDIQRALCIPAGYSYGRQPDGSENKVHFSLPSPGTSNNLSTAVPVNPVADTLIFSRESGFYTEAFTLHLVTSNPQTQVYYTTSGAEPDDESDLYTGNIGIRSRKGEKNEFAKIPTSPYWQKPPEVFKGTVVRAVAYSDGCPVSPVLTNTYFVDEKIFTRYGFPIVSISTDKDNFFDHDFGIYVQGPYAAEDQGNYTQKGEAWERPVHFEFFTTDGVLAIEQELGARIHGRFSRIKPQKSLRLYAKEKYGEEYLNYKFFPDKDIARFKRLILRTTDNHYSTTFFKDELIHHLIKDMKTGIQAHLPVIAFVNGEYWGIHNLRERQDKYYLQDNFNADPENIDYRDLSLEGEENIEGDELHYNAMLNFISTHDMAEDENYNYVKTQMDVESFIDNHITHLYFANYDWPRNNIRYWRPKTSDGKWQWLFFDCDLCMIVTDYNHLRDYTVGQEKFEDFTVVIRALLQNKEFRHLFRQRFMHHLSTTFNPGHVLKTIEDFQQIYAPMVNEHIERWRMPETFVSWNDNVEYMKNFAMERPVEMLNQLVGIYGKPYVIRPNPAAEAFYLDVPPAEEAPMSLKLFNSLGSLILSRNIDAASTPVDISLLPAGLYVLQVQYGNLLFSDKVVVH